MPRAIYHKSPIVAIPYTTLVIASDASASRGNPLLSSADKAQSAVCWQFDVGDYHVVHSAPAERTPRNDGLFGRDTLSQTSCHCDPPLSSTDRV